MTIIFDDEINLKSVDRFTNDLDNMVRILGKDETIDLYLSTNGGENGLMYALVNTIKKYSDKLVIYLIDIMYSSGFLMLWYLRDYNIYMLPSYQISMMHTVACKVSTRDVEMDVIIEELNKENALWASRFIELGVSKEDINKFYNKQDVYLSREQTLKLFPNIQEIEEI